MHPELPGRRRRSRSANGRACAAAYERAGHAVETITPKPRPARHGVRRQQRARPRRHRVARPLPPPAAHGRGTPRTSGGSAPTASTVRRAEHVHEGEGDFVVVGDVILGGTGFRTDPARAPRGRAALRARGRDARTRRPALLPPRHRAVRARPTTRSRTTRPRSPSRAEPVLAAPLPRRGARRPSTTSSAFGCNAASDGHHVFMPAGADDLAGELDGARVRAGPVELSELRKAGGSVKCCTLELRGDRRCDA